MIIYNLNSILKGAPGPEILTKLPEMFSRGTAERMKGKAYLNKFIDQVREETQP